MGFKILFSYSDTESGLHFISCIHYFWTPLALDDIQCFGARVDYNSTQQPKNLKAQKDDWFILFMEIGTEVMKYGKQ